MFKLIRNKGQDMFETHIEDLVRSNHPYRKLLKSVDFKGLCKPLKKLFSEDRGRKGYHIESGSLIAHKSTPFFCAKRNPRRDKPPFQVAWLARGKDSFIFFTLHLHFL
jgi:hypothetical protein